MHEERHPVASKQLPWLTLKTIPLLCVLVVQFGLNFSIATFCEVKDDSIAAIVVGSVFSQIVIYAIWCALAPIRTATRMLVGFSAFTVAALCLYRCAQRDGGGNEVAITITGAMIAQWILYQVPLWHTRWRGRCLSITSNRFQTASNELQFGIAQLLTWTTIIAVFLGIVRILLDQFDHGMNVGVLRLEMFVSMSLGNTLLALPLIYACFSNSRTATWFGLAFLWAVGVTVTETVLLRGVGDDTFFISTNAVQFVVVLISLAAARFAGIRLAGPEST